MENQRIKIKKYLLWQKYLGHIMTAGLISSSCIESQHVYTFANVSKFIHQMKPAHRISLNGGDFTAWQYCL